ncbi:chlorophyllase-1-like [Curcuma longa]|uniref:chlorophyllase-1-like n=1 Tax=Curcuma longa TaxID=136217 RepID=UPI003D9DC1E0
MATIFDLGKLSVEIVTKDSDRRASSPPKSLLVVTPSEPGSYHVVLFIHGFFLHTLSYLQILRHIASHGFILVAPQFFTIFPSSPEEDIAAAAAVCDWLPEGLQSLLPEGVTADLDHLGLSGHSRGGHTAFALALGHAKTSLKFSALIGVDPVAGRGRSNQVSPEILTYVPSSFALDFPVLVIGTGLGSQRKSLLLPPCAPEGVNHDEFYRESRPTCYHLVAKDFGHLDMLDDGAAPLQKIACKCGDEGGKDAMRRTTAGVMTAFLKAYLRGEGADLDAVVRNPGLAPTTLDPVEYRLKSSALAGVIRSKL